MESLITDFTCYFKIEKFGLNSVDIKEILLDMRKYRMGLIQTPEQLRFSYQAIIEGAKQLLNKNNSEPDEVCCRNKLIKLIENRNLIRCCMKINY